MWDDNVLKVFLDKQLKLFPKKVAETKEEAADFLDECGALVVEGKEEVWEYFDGEDIDMEGAGSDEIIFADEVFDIGDGRYLIVEG